MSSYRNANKSKQRTHKERSQPKERAHLGFLEKKKDYKLRADDYQQKEKTLRALKRKALDRNPDEFYFKMIKTQKVDGVHQRKELAEPVYTDAQLKLMESQDLRYVNYKRTTELKKIEKLKSSLHLLDSNKPKNKHTVFVDSKKDVVAFDAAKHFNTHPELVIRAYNRPTRKSLKKQDLFNKCNEETIQVLAEERDKKYRELSKRIDRLKELNVLAQKMETKKLLLDKTAEWKKVKKETKNRPAVYRWVFQRKR